MTKKQGKLKTEKKAAKPVKKSSATKSKPMNVAKTAKKITKPAGKSLKPVVKAAAKKVATNKTEKKAAKPVKKQEIVKKVIKAVKAVAETVKEKLTKATNKKPAKPEKKAATKEKTKKEEIKTITLVVPVKKKANEKPAKADKKKDKIKDKPKEKPSKKKKKTDDDEEDVEIVDLWETVEEDEEIEVEPTKPAAKGKGGRKPKSASDDDEPVIENDILIEQLIQSTKKLRKPSAKVPQQIRTFTNPMASLTVAADTKKAAPKKEPKGKFELEYVIRTAAPILYEFLTSPSGLSEWFADDVNIHDGVFTFFWDGSEQKARLLGFKDEKYIKLQWLDKPDGTYFEFRIEKDELTGDVSLIVTDFADEASDMQTSKLLWDSQVNKLSQVIGSYS